MEVVVEDQEEAAEGKEAGVQAAKVLDRRCRRADPAARGRRRARTR